MLPPLFFFLFFSILVHQNTKKSFYVKTCRAINLLLFLILTFFVCGFPLGEDKQGSVRSILEHVQSYEITYPTWLPPHRHRRSANIEVSHSASPSGPLANKMIKTLDVDISQLLFSELLVPDGPHVFLALPVSYRGAGSDLS